MTAASRRKVSSDLQAKLEQLPRGNSVEVVIELEAPSAPLAGNRAERIAAARQTFDEVLQPLRAKILSLGGEVLESAWLNATVRGRVPTIEVEGLADDDSVRTLDVPSRLTAE